MKTTKSNQVKSLNMISGCFLLSLIFTCSGASCLAQKAENNTHTLLAKAKVQQSEFFHRYNLDAINDKSSFYEYDPMLETWMTELSYWNRTEEFPFSDSDLEFADWIADISGWYEKEMDRISKDLKLDGGWIDYSRWETGIDEALEESSLVKSYRETFEEPSLVEMEIWMIDYTHWEINIKESFEEPELHLENWMTDLKEW